MKSLKKISCLLLMISVFFFAGTGLASAAAQNATVSGKGVMNSLIGNDYIWGKFELNGKTAYCMDSNKEWPDNGSSYTYSKEADAGVKYIIENGYPYKCPYAGCNDDVNRYITQAAIWWYLADTGQGAQLTTDFTTNAGDQANVRPIIKQLVADAKNAKASKKATIGDIANGNLKITGDSYVSSEIAPVLDGVETYTVSLEGAPAGAVVTSTSGEAKTTFNKGEKFLVKVPASAVKKDITFTVKVTSTKKENKALIYNPTDASRQKVVTVVEEEEEKLEKSFKLSATAEKVDPSKVCVTYEIVGNVRPDESLTDPTPDKECVKKGSTYDQKKELTTRQNSCKFNGWYTNKDLTGKWKDGTKLNNDMTLYGAWDCGTTINVPSTAANTPLIILGSGLVVIAAGLGVYFIREKKLKANK